MGVWAGYNEHRMATLYTHKSANIQRTWALMTAFVALLAGVGWLLSYTIEGGAFLFPIAIAFAVFTSVGSYWFSDKLVIAMSRARPLTKEDDPELYRLVENLAITAGLPMPKLYLVDDPAPNAFATGRDPNHAVVAVTTGLRHILEKRELEGVIAHELSHIGNRDMLVATVAAVLAGTLVMISDIFFRMMFWGGGDRRSRNGSALMVVGLIAALVLAPIAATLLRLAISRKREFLADASGALLTRFPEGLATALQKIHHAAVPMRHRSSAMAHLWLSDPEPRRKRSSFAKMFMTHPPVEERLAALGQMQIS